MGTVGINFGSATSGAGFNVAATVTAILSAQQAIQTPIQTQLTALQAQDTVFTTLGTDLSTLTTNLQSLTNATGPLAQKQGSSSNTNIVALTSADTTAVAGSHTIVVASLAVTASSYSASIANASDILSGSVTINGQQINVASGTSDTLATFATAINAAAIGVTASIISDANGSRLNLVSNTSGATGSVTVSSALNDGSTAIGFTQGPAAANASLTVDGLQIASASNTVTGAIPGVTFQVLSQSPGTNVQVQVTNDNTAIETAVNSVVTAYNAVIADINGQEQNNASGVPEPLFGSSTLTLIQSQLQGALFGGSASGSISNVNQLGISIADNGTLTLDTSALDSSLNAHFSDIAGYLQNAGSFGQNFQSVLNNLGTQAPNGAVYLAQQQNSAQEAAFSATIASDQAALTAEQTTLTAELNAANQVLQSIPLQLSQVNEIYSAISGYNQVIP